jgi:hypothetical protein
MPMKDKSSRAYANKPQIDKGHQGVRQNRKDPGKNTPNPHREHQDRHGGGEGETGMQPGAGHPRGR